MFNYTQWLIFIVKVKYALVFSFSLFLFWKTKQMTFKDCKEPIKILARANTFVNSTGLS